MRDHTELTSYDDPKIVEISFVNAKVVEIKLQRPMRVDGKVSVRRTVVLEPQFKQYCDHVSNNCVMNVNYRLCETQRKVNNVRPSTFKKFLNVFLKPWVNADCSELGFIHHRRQARDMLRLVHEGLYNPILFFV